LNDINSFTVKSYDLFMKPLILYIIDKRTLNVECRYAANIVLKYKVYMYEA
jgi:hypothetical protein